MICRVVQKHLSAYVDGELEPSRTLEVEQHLGGCGDCELARGFLAALKHEVCVRGKAPAAPVDLRARVEAAMGRISIQEGERDTGHTWTVAAVAASVLLVVGSLVGTDRRAEFPKTAALLPFEIAKDVIERHKDELPAEIATKEPQRATSWFRDKVGFRVRSVEFAEPSVHFTGARISQVGAQQAAKLYYNVGDDSRLTLVMFKAPPPLSAVLTEGRGLERFGAHRIRISGRDVTYHTLQGYTVPMLQDNGIVYAFAGDLDQSSLLKLVANARIPH
jgi:hypothetical protein